MALSIQELATALRVDLDAAGTQEALLARLLAVAEASIDRFAPDAPTPIADEAASRMVGYLYDQPGGASASGRYAQNALRSSGASALLAPWRTHRGGRAGRASAAVVPPAGPGDDEAARQAARQAQATATQALVAAEQNTGFLRTFGARVRTIVEAVVPAWARAQNPPDAGDDLPAYQQAETQGLFSRAGALFWKAVQEVPDTPGDASGVHHLLTVTGENDADYRWQPITAVPAFKELSDGHTADVKALADADARIVSSTDLQTATASTVREYQAVLAAQLAASTPLLVVATAAIKGVFGSRPVVQVDYPKGQVFWFAPASAEPTLLFVLPDPQPGAVDADARAAAAAAQGTATGNTADIAAVKAIADANKTAVDALDAVDGEFITVEPSFIAKTLAGLRTPLTVVLHGVTAANRADAAKAQLWVGGQRVLERAWAASDAGDRVLVGRLDDTQAGNAVRNLRDADHIAVSVNFIDGGGSADPRGRLHYSLPFGEIAAAEDPWVEFITISPDEWLGDNSANLFGTGPEMTGFDEGQKTAFRNLRLGLWSEIRIRALRVTVASTAAGVYSDAFLSADFDGALSGGDRPGEFTSRGHAPLWLDTDFGENKPGGSAFRDGVYGAYFSVAVQQSQNRVLMSIHIDGAPGKPKADTFITVAGR